MDIDHFTGKYGVTGESHMLTEFTTVTDPDEHGHRHKLVQRQWAVVLQHSVAGLDDQRALLIDYRTGTGITDPDPEEVLEDYARRALEGTMTFPDFADERGAFQPDPRDPSRITGHLSAAPARLYAAWIGVVDAHHKLVDWCASPGMLADLYAVHTG